MQAIVITLKPIVFLCMQMIFLKNSNNFAYVYCTANKDTQYPYPLGFGNETKSFELSMVKLIT